MELVLLWNAAIGAAGIVWLVGRAVRKLRHRMRIEWLAHGGGSGG